MDSDIENSLLGLIIHSPDRYRLETLMTLPQTIDIELTLSARVTVTQEVLDGIADQYPDLYEAGKDDAEVIARAMLYASVNPRIMYNNTRFSDIWDGVAEMQGLITDVELCDY